MRTMERKRDLDRFLETLPGGVRSADAVVLYLAQCDVEVDGRREVVLTPEWRGEIYAAEGGGWDLLSRAVASTLTNVTHAPGHAAYFRGCVRNMEQGPRHPVVSAPSLDRFTEEDDPGLGELRRIDPSEVVDLPAPPVIPVRSSSGWLSPEEVHASVQGGEPLQASRVYHWDLDDQLPTPRRHYVATTEYGLRTFCGHEHPLAKWSDPVDDQALCTHCTSCWDRAHRDVG